jgi:hypothetical protein
MWAARGNPAWNTDHANAFSVGIFGTRGPMNRRDQELLDKQLWGVSPSPPRNRGALSLAFLAVFLGGLTVGGFLFAHKNDQAQQRTAQDPLIALSLLNGTPQTLR